MSCWPLGILDRGKKGTLEEGDRILKREESRNPKAKCLVTSLKPLDYFSGGAGDQSPLDRLRVLVEAEPQIRTVNPELLRHIFDQQREWLRNNTGH